MTTPLSVAAEGFAAGLAASVACGLGALPLALRGLSVEKRIGLGYGFAGGLMFAASVYNLLLPALALGEGATVRGVAEILAGFFLGAWFLSATERALTPERLSGRWAGLLGGKTGALVFVAMSLHSVPEGVAVGVGYGAEAHLADPALGPTIALAIAIHNIPEGLAVALPMRAAGATIGASFLAAFLTSLPQPVASVPASLFVYFFEPLMRPLLGLSAGAMIHLVLLELVPDALDTRSRAETAWSFLAGFAAMVAVQVVL